MAKNYQFNANLLVLLWSCMEDPLVCDPNMTHVLGPWPFSQEGINPFAKNAANESAEEGTRSAYDKIMDLVVSVPRPVEFCFCRNSIRFQQGING